MAAYATRTDLAAYVEGLIIDDPAATDRLLERCSGDIDRLLGPWPVQTTGPYTGRKLNPDALAVEWKWALRDATCAQAEYRGIVGEQALSVPPARVSGPDFTVDRTPQDGDPPAGIGPKVMGELTRVPGLVRRWVDGTPSYTTRPEPRRRTRLPRR
jgi:hypothetical protein